MERCCDWCGCLLPPPSPKARVARRFCSSVCRSRYHAARRQEALQALTDALAAAGAALGRLVRRSDDLSDS
jgi:hypothetical protein